MKTLETKVEKCLIESPMLFCLLSNYAHEQIRNL